MKPLFLSFALLSGCDEGADVRRAEVTQDSSVMEQFVSEDDSEFWSKAAQKCSMKSENFINKTHHSYRASLGDLDGIDREAEMEEVLIGDIRASYFSDCMERLLADVEHCQLVPTQAIEERNAMGQWVPKNRAMEMSVWRLALDQEWEHFTHEANTTVWGAIPDNPEYDFRCAVGES